MRWCPLLGLFLSILSLERGASDFAGPSTAVYLQWMSSQQTLASGGILLISTFDGGVPFLLNVAIPFSSSGSG